MLGSIFPCGVIGEESFTERNAEHEASDLYIYCFRKIREK